MTTTETCLIRALPGPGPQQPWNTSSSLLNTFIPDICCMLMFHCGRRG